MTTKSQGSSASKSDALAVEAASSATESEWHAEAPRWPQDLGAPPVLEQKPADFPSLAPYDASHPYRPARSEALKETGVKNEKLERAVASIECGHETVERLLDELPSITLYNIGCLVTLTGDPGHAQAATCHNYVSRVWPGTGTIALSVFLDLLMKYKHNQEARPLRSKKYFAKEQLKIFLQMLPKSDIFNIDVTGKLSDVTNIIQQLIWIASVFRKPHESSAISLTRANCKLLDESESLGMDLNPPSFSLFDRVDGCWTPLFEGTSLASGFPICARPKELERCDDFGYSDTFDFKGLEIDYDIMLYLTGIQRAFEFEDSIVLKGYSTLLIPLYCEKSCVQWHLYADKVTVPINLESCLESFLSSRESLAYGLLGKNVREMRHFIGWCPEARIHLGTEDATYGQSAESSTGREHTIFQVESLQTIFGTSGMGYVTAQGGVTFKPLREVRTNANSRNTDPLRDIDWINRAQGRHVVLYDTECETGWIVPEISFVWHCVLEWMFKNGKTRADIPFYAEASPDGEKAALSILLEPPNWNTRLQDDLDGSEITVGDRLKRFLQMIEQRREADFLRRSERHNLQRPWRGPKFRRVTSSIFPLHRTAWDLSEILRLDKFTIRRVFECQGFNRTMHNIWCHQEDLFVICGDHLGNPIMPAPSMRSYLCSTCHTVPRDRENLIAMVHSVETVLHTAKTTLNRVPIHIEEEDLFRACPDRKKCCHFHRAYQSLQYRSGHMEGAIVLGVNEIKRKGDECDP